MAPRSGVHLSLSSPSPLLLQCPSIPDTPSLTLLPPCIAAPSVLAQLSARRDSQQKRVDSLLKLKNEFQELAKIL